MAYDYTRISKLIDHSLLVPTLTRRQIEDGLETAIAYDVASVCIMPAFHKRCVERLAGTGVLPSSTVGFPHGANATETKLDEARRLVDEGCAELDMVVSIASVLSDDHGSVEREIAGVVEIAHAANRKVKVIFENCYLRDEHKVRLCQICCDVGADWVKTSTGFGTGGATLEDLRLMLDNVRPPVQVKAAGGIRDYDSLIKVMEMGVTRVGSSRTGDLLGPARSKAGLPPVQSSAALASSY